MSRKTTPFCSSRYGIRVALIFSMVSGIMSSLFAISFIFIVAGCGTGGSFSEAMPVAIVQSEATPSPLPPAPPPHKTIIQLLTPSINNGKPNQFLRFLISYQNAEGSAEPIPSVHLKFDINGSMAFLRRLNFSYQGAPDLSGTGRFSPQLGKDLFDHLGPTFSHWQSDEKIQVEEDIYSIVVAIDLSNIAIHQRNPPATLPPSEAVTTYLQLGDDASVATISVNFLNQ